MMPRAATVTCIVFIVSLAQTFCISHGAAGSDSGADDRRRPSHVNTVLNHIGPVLRARQQRSSLLAVPHSVKKRSSVDGAVSDFSRNEISSFRDIKYRYMGLGKRLIDPMNFNVGLGKRGAERSKMAAEAQAASLRPTTFIHSRDITPFSFDVGGGYAGSGANVASQQSYDFGGSQASWGDSSDEEEQLSRMSLLESVRKRLGRSFRNRLGLFGMGTVSRRGQFDPKINFLGLGK